MSARAVNRALVLPIDRGDVGQFCELLAHQAERGFRYVVTPNVDHLIRYCEDPAFRQAYEGAAYVLLDSRFLSHWLALTRRVRLPVCPGSDLTAQLFANVLRPTDRIVLVGGTARQAQGLRERFGLSDLRHIDPPMGFAADAPALEACLASIESASPFRFCFLAVGSPQQERVARALQARGVARGTALCVGAAINFLTGTESRAPPWMRRIGLEWLYRLLRDPVRLSRRYLVRGPRVFLLLPRLELQARAPLAGASPRTVNSV